MRDMVKKAHDAVVSQVMSWTISLHLYDCFSGNKVINYITFGLVARINGKGRNRYPTMIREEATPQEACSVLSDSLRTKTVVTMNMFE